MDFVRASAPKTKFVVKKPRSPFVLANVSYESGNSTQMLASLPLIIYSEDSVIDIEDVPVYKKAEPNRRKPRSNKTKLLPVYEPLWLYQKVSGK